MGADLNSILKCQKLTDEHVQFLVYQILRGLKVGTELNVSIAVDVIGMTVLAVWMYISIVTSHIVSRPRTEQGRRSFKHRAAIAWNSLPDTIKQLENPLSFKRKIKSIKTYVRDISFQKECSVNYNKNPEFRYF